MKLFLHDGLMASMPSIEMLEEIDKKIYSLILQRKSNKEIAQILGIKSSRTVENYRQRIYDELLGVEIDPKTEKRKRHHINDLLEFAKRNGHIS